MDEQSERTGLEIAVIGMSGRFPDAENIEQFWDNLKNGRESISFFTDDELKEEGLEPTWLEHPNYVRAKGSIDGIEYFDAAFFGYTPGDARTIDPQSRFSLECSWEALEDAGCEPGSYHGLIGVFTSASDNIVWKGKILFSTEGNFDQFSGLLLSNKDCASLMVSYKLGLKGPSITMYTACSSSLSAIHVACQAILNGECDIALAGGVRLILPNKIGYLYEEGMIVAPDGHCRAFDAKARGTLGGSGVGVVVLKRLEEAVEDRDHIYAVVRGSAVNNDGLRKVGFTAPSIEGQAEVIRTAHQIAHVEAESISYIEAHGTGTVLGDPVEFEGLKSAFNSGKKGLCALGSVKTNIGHLDTAAGVAGFIKAVLALKYKAIPPSLHFEEPNSKIDFENSPFYVNTGLTGWKNRGYPLRAGVSSFGIGGTNAHIVLEEWTGAPYPGAGTGEQRASREYQLIVLSAKTQTSLEKMTENLAGYLENNRRGPGIDLADVAYTLQTGRKAFKYRRMLVCSTADECASLLSSPESRKVHTSAAETKKIPVVFMFSGLGAQYVDMGLGLYETEPVFREEMDRCFDILRPLTDYDVKDILYPLSGGNRSNRTDKSYKTYTEKINRTDIAQVVVFIFEYALAKLIMSWGIAPRAMIGYSFGEYAAACISGVFSLEDALKLVVIRGEMIRRVTFGAMLSVPLPLEKLKPLVNENISIAIDNGPSCIVAGRVEAIDAFEKQLKEKRYLCVKLSNSHAIHSKMMEPLLKEFEEHVGRVRLNVPRIPYVSNVTGTWINGGDAADPAYWARHMRETVQFAAGVRELVKIEHAVFIEIGPGRDLSSLVVRYIENPSEQGVLNTVKPPIKEVHDVYYLLNRIGQLWGRGACIDWSGFYSHETRYRVSLPTYCFEKQRHWIDGDPFKIGAEMLRNKTRGHRAADSADWCYLPSWKRSLPKPQKQGGPAEAAWLVFADELNIGNRLRKRLEEKQRQVIFVEKGDTFKPPADDNKSRTYTLNPEEHSDYNALFNALRDRGLLPGKIIHCWNITGEATGVPGVGSFDKAQYPGFFSLLYLVKAIETQDFNHDIHITLLSSHLQDVTGSEALCPEKAPVLGLLKTIPQEYPGIRCTAVDIVPPVKDSPGETALIDSLMEEFFSLPDEPVVAYRNNRRWVQTFESVQLEAPGTESGGTGLRERGVYLVTGGLGTIGLIFADLLVRRAGARLVLTGRSPFPPREEWDQWLDGHDTEDPVSLKIGKLRELLEPGGEVLYIRADVSDPGQMRNVLKRTRETFGEVNGVIHAAGILEGDSMRSIRQLSMENCRAQFQAKVYGTMVLGELFNNRELDFCWMLSSISCVLGGLGFGAYAAANTFMDVFVKRHNRLEHPASPWFTLNWDGMEQDKSAAIFERLFLLRNVEQLAVSRGGDLWDRIDRWVKLESLTDAAQNFNEDPSTLNFKTRPNLMSPYEEPADEIEKSIVEIWQHLFGYEQIGIEDDFFELGGDSIKALTMAARVKKIGYPVALNDILANPTVKTLAVEIREKQTAKERAAEIHEENLLDRLECIEKLNKGRNGRNIFMVHPMHGMVNQYKELAGFLGGHYNVYGIQARGLVPGSRAAETPEGMIADYLEQILAVQSGGPFIIAGYCVGVLIAYEIVRKLESLNHTVAKLILIDSPNPFSGPYTGLLKIIERLPSFTAKMIDSYRKRKFRKRTLKLKAGGNGMDNNHGDETVDDAGLRMETLSRNNRFLAGYMLPLGIIEAPILVPLAEASDYPGATEAYFSRLTEGDAAVIKIPGDHDSILEKPHVENLARILKEM